MMFSDWICVVVLCDLWRFFVVCLFICMVCRCWGWCGWWCCVFWLVGWGWVVLNGFGWWFVLSVLGWSVWLVFIRFDLCCWFWCCGWWWLFFLGCSGWWCLWLLCCWCGLNGWDIFVWLRLLFRIGWWWLLVGICFGCLGCVLFSGCIRVCWCGLVIGLCGCCWLVCWLLLIRRLVCFGVGCVLCVVLVLGSFCFCCLSSSWCICWTGFFLLVCLGWFSFWWWFLCLLVVWVWWVLIWILVLGVCVMCLWCCICWCLCLLVWNLWGIVLGCSWWLLLLVLVCCVFGIFLCVCCYVCFWWFVSWGCFCLVFVSDRCWGWFSWCWGFVWSGSWWLWRSVCCCLGRIRVWGIFLGWLCCFWLCFLLLVGCWCRLVLLFVWWWVLFICVRVGILLVLDFVRVWLWCVWVWWMYWWRWGLNDFWCFCRVVLGFFFFLLIFEMWYSLYF